MGLGLGMGLGMVLGLGLGTGLALRLRVDWVLCITAQIYSNKNFALAEDSEKNKSSTEDFQLSPNIPKNNFSLKSL